MTSALWGSLKRHGQPLKVFAAFSNPIPIVLDRIGIRRSPYILRTRSGSRFLVRPSTGDRYAAYEVFGLQVYRAAERWLKPGDVAIDVGANIGCFSLLAASRVGAHGRVIAVEPEQSAFEILSANIRLNGLTQIAALRMAVTGSGHDVEVIVSSTQLFTSIYPVVDRHKVEGATQRVSGTTLQALLKSHDIDQVDLLKLDCEGAEHDIIAGMTPSLARRIRRILMEVHEVPGKSPSTTIERLRILGYRHIINGVHGFERLGDT